MIKRTILITAIAIPLIFAGVFAYNTFTRARASRAQATEARKAAWARLRTYIDRAVKGYRGKAAIVIRDLDTGWEIASNKDMAVPSASLVKIPVMMACFAAADEKKLKLSDTVELRSSDKVDGSGPVKNGASGSMYRIEDLLYLMITESDNTATNMLIGRIGIDELNGYFAKFGLRHTNLSRKMMDFKSRREGKENYTTVGDMAYLLERLYDGKFLNKRVSDRCLALLADQKINDRIPKKLPSGIMVAHKTGLENGVCHDVGIVYTPKGNFLICVLTKHEYTTARPTKRLISRLSLITYNYYSWF